MLELVCARVCCMCVVTLVCVPVLFECVHLWICVYFYVLHLCISCVRLCVYVLQCVTDIWGHGAVCVVCVP